MSLEKSVAIVFGLAVLSGCHSSSRIPVPAPGSTLEGAPEHVTVTRQDRSTFEIYDPLVQGDSLVGYLDPATASMGNRQRVALALGDVRQITAMKVSKGKTTGLAVGGAGVLTLVVLVALAAASLAVLTALGQ